MKLAGLPAPAAFLVFSLSATSCTRSGSNTASAAGPALPTVDVTTLKFQKLSTTERLPAELLPYESVDIYAGETGFVKSIRVDRGAKVKQGERIAEIEAPELVAQRAQANAAYQSAESQLAAAQAKLSADQDTFEHLQSASKVPGVVGCKRLGNRRKDNRIG